MSEGIRVVKNRFLSKAKLKEARRGSPVVFY